MSKKMRKKSSKQAAGKAARTQQVSRAKPSRNAGHPASPATSKEPKAGSAKSRSESSHRGTEKPLRASASRRPAAKASRSKSGATRVSRGAGLTEGAKAPAFNLPRDGGTHVSLSDFAGQKLVIFFYPRADTPGCTREAMDFTRLASEFARCGTTVLGVSADPLKAQESFRTKHKLTIPLISDEKHDMLEAYGVWGEKSMYGKTFLGILRTTVLVNEDGRIARIWHRVKVDGHAEDVLAAVRSP